MLSSIFVLHLIGLATLLNAFRAVWNFYDKACSGKTASDYVDFKKYNIEFNKGHEFWGEKVAIFYEFSFGKYPYYKDYNKSIPINGGLPQNCDFTAHLDVVKQNITRKIKVRNATVIGIIDFEEWRPLFSENGYNLKRQKYHYERPKQEVSDLIIAVSDNATAVDHCNKTVGLKYTTPKRMRHSVNLVANGRTFSEEDALWNFFDEICEKKGKVEFASYQIEANQGRKFWGEKIAIFYEYNFTTYPYYKGYNLSNPIAGGNPQDCDLSAFLKEFEQRINVAIEPNFSGLGVIDLEHWRPLFEENGNDKMRIYQNVSIEKAKKQYPNLTEPEVKKKAAEEYDEAAMGFFVKTIEKAHELRPNGTWGFYGLPYCNFNAGKNNESECSKEWQGWNDRMMAIFNKSDALYPSIYLGEKDKITPDRSDRYIYAILKEARRIAHKFSPPLPIYTYTKFEYDPQTQFQDFYSEADLCRTIKKPGDMGIDGIIYWSSSRNITHRCVYIKDEVTNPVGPHTNDTVIGHKSCREKLCKGHGKCVSKTNTTCTDKNDYSVKESEYMCECDFGYVGDSCDHTTTTTTTTTPKPKR
ncbi:hypothetical protein RB195_020731 [Necator americanus]|uniref:Hyaluronidase n=1 Tax=Necator americanus TaxID=51031 RepID=A0ABR1CM99_NECAM